MKVVDLKELALKKVKITGDVIGKFGTFEIEQLYKNNTKDVLEVEYTFPIVETATVVGFEINIGDKILKGKCKETGKAKKEYQRNIVKGNSSYMMEQKSDNIFKISIGKIDKNEEIKLKIYYIDKFDITDNTIKILMPTLITPRYKSDITAKLSYGEVDYTIDFNIKINKALNRKSINCVSHTINVIDEENFERIEVLNYDLSKDFKLYIELKNELTSNAIFSKSRDGKDMIYVSFMPEILDVYEDNEKEYIFIIDVSGSMYGKKIDETKRAVIECLKQLDIGDRFNIIAFESEFEAMNIAPIEYNEKNFEKAVNYINNLKPLGGTEILNPIKFALSEKENDKIMLLFTDGQVGNEKEIIEYVEKNINRSRIFSFGIDTNVNSYFIKQLAKVGNGKEELIQPNEKIDDKIIRTFSRIQTPLLEEIIIDYGNNKVIDEIKEEKCLFNYEFYNVFTKIEKIEDDIYLKGKILNKEYVFKISKESIKETEINLEVLFAKLEMERLEEYIKNTSDDEKINNYKNMIIELSEKYNINSKYTSFITVYERDNKILEVPKLQNTTLSNRFLKSAIVDGALKMMGTAKAVDCEERGFYEDEECEEIVVDRSSNLELPRFLRKTPMVESRSLKREEPRIRPKSDIEILKEFVENYYQDFEKNENKSILSYLLYAIYFLGNKNIQFEEKNLIGFLNLNRKEILENELYMTVLYSYYRKLCNIRSEYGKDVFELLGDKYKKIVNTNVKINVDIKNLTKENIQSIIDKNNMKENLDNILWYIINNSDVEIQWL